MRASRILAFVLLGAVSWAEGANWPGWRGDGSGISRDGKPRIKWGASEGILWKTPIPGKGFSSPIVFKDRVFITTAKQGLERKAARVLTWRVLGALALLAGLCYGLELQNQRRRKFARLRLQSELHNQGWGAVFPPLLMCLFFGGLVVAELSINGEWYLARKWVSGSLPRGWLVSGMVCSLGLVAVVLFARNWRGFLWVAAFVTAGMSIFFLYAIPDPRLYRLESSRIAESTLAVSGMVLGLIFRSHYRVGGYLASFAIVLTSTAFVAYLHLGGLPSLGSLRFKIIAGLFAGFVLAVVSYSLAAPSERSRAATAKVEYALPAVVCIILVLVAGTHFYCAHFLLPEKGAHRTVVCLDLSTGKILWEQGFPAEEELLVAGNSYATPTPVTDGEHVCAYFGNAGAMCVNYVGQQLWVNRNLPLETDYGAGSSPVIGKGLVYIACDQKAESYVRAFDVATGEIRWSRTRESREGFSTPLLTRINDLDQLLVNGGGLFNAYNIATGTELWSTRLPRSHETTPSLVVDRDVAYVGRSYANDFLTAYRLYENSPPTQIWTTKERVLGYCSPLVADGFVYVVTNGGIARCVEATTGEVLWRERLGGNYTASPVMADNKIFFLSKDGNVTVIAAGPVFQILAKNSIGEDSVGSPGVAGDKILLRSAGHLWCFGSAAPVGVNPTLVSPVAR
jgi:outer membrane protein assembly factor BamB